MVEEELLSSHIIEIWAYRNHPKLTQASCPKPLALSFTKPCCCSLQEDVSSCISAPAGTCSVDEGRLIHSGKGERCWKKYCPAALEGRGGEVPPNTAEQGWCQHPDLPQLQGGKQQEELEPAEEIWRWKYIAHLGFFLSATGGFFSGENTSPSCVLWRPG